MKNNNVDTMNFYYTIGNKKDLSLKAKKELLSEIKSYLKETSEKTDELYRENTSEKIRNSVLTTLNNSVNEYLENKNNYPVSNIREYIAEDVKNDLIEKMKTQEIDFCDIKDESISETLFNNPIMKDMADIHVINNILSISKYADNDKQSNEFNKMNEICNTLNISISKYFTIVIGSALDLARYTTPMEDGKKYKQF